MQPSFIPDKQKISHLVARMLLEVQAVDFNTASPFTLASGLKSPVYVDCRKLISYPRIRSCLMDFLTATVMKDAGFEAFDSVAGGETAGIPFAAMIAERMSLPMSYVRKKSKGYGRNSRIEGNMAKGDRVLMVEDLATDGGSKISFAEAIRDTGAVCSHAAVIFYYGIFEETVDFLGGHGIKLHYLCTWHDVIAEVRTSNVFDAATLDEVQDFLDNPRKWQANNR